MTCSADPCCQPWFCALRVMRQCWYFPNHKHQVWSRAKTELASSRQASVRLLGWLQWLFCIEAWTGDSQWEAGRGLWLERDRRELRYLAWRLWADSWMCTTFCGSQMAKSEGLKGRLRWSLRLNISSIKFVNWLFLSLLFKQLSAHVLCWSQKGHVSPDLLLSCHV